MDSIMRGRKRCNSVVDHLLRWVIGSILPGGHIELFLVPSSAPQEEKERLSVCRMVQIKDILLLIGKSSL